MNQSSIIPEEVKAHFSAHASLAVIGIALRQRRVFEPIAAKVKIAQKTVKASAIEKLQDAFIAILSGAHGLVEINTGLRADVELQSAFRRDGCAEQLLVTFDTWCAQPAFAASWTKAGNCPM